MVRWKHSLGGDLEEVQLFVPFFNESCVRRFRQMSELSAICAISQLAALQAMNSEILLAKFVDGE